MKIKIIVLLLFFISLSQVIKAQNNKSKWAFGLSIGSAMYSDEDGAKVGGAYAKQIPIISLSRYMFKNVTFDATFGYAGTDTQKYTTFDGSARYDFGASYENVVPYVFIGGSIINALRPTPTLNFGVGNTLWIHPKFGLNFQLMYKFSETRFESQFSHIYSSVGIVYSFKARNMRPRLWDIEH